MTATVFREFLEQHSEANIVMVSRKNFAALFTGIPNLRFHGINVDDYKGFLGMRKLCGELIKLYNPDLIADLHDVIRTKIMDGIFRRRQYEVFKIDKGKEEKEELIDVWNLDKKQLKQTVERYADVFREMGFPVHLSHQLRSSCGHKSGIGFAPFAQHKGKMLPLEKSFKIAQILSETHKIYFLGGGPEESRILEDWSIQIQNSENLSGKLTLNEELQKISNFKVMISMDSANMHLASLVGTRCISVWCQTHPFAGFLGYGQSKNDVVQIKDLTCRPCSVFGDKECYRGDWACFEEIKIQMVINKVLQTV